MYCIRDCTGRALSNVPLPVLQTCPQCNTYLTQTERGHATIKVKLGMKIV